MVAVNGIGNEYGPPKRRGILEWGIFLVIVPMPIFMY